MDMKPNDVLEKYPSQERIAEALGLSQSTVSRWFVAGAVPPHVQVDLAILTKGGLRLDADALRYAEDQMQRCKRALELTYR